MEVVNAVSPQDIIGFIREINERTRFSYGLERFLPNTRRTTPEFSWVVADPTGRDSAVYRQWDAESPVAKRQAFTKKAAALAPISEKIPLTEELKLRLEAASSGDTSRIRSQLFDDLESVVTDVTIRIERGRGEMLETAKLILNENGVVSTLDTGRDASMVVTASPLWSTVTTADPIKDINTWSNTYYALNMVRPGLMVMSAEVESALLLNDKIRTTASSLIGAPSILARGQLQQTFGAQGIPPYVIYDGRGRVGGTLTRFISEKKVIFFPPATEPIGETQFIPTAESLSYLGKGYYETAEEAATITGTIWTEPDPSITWTKAASNVIPFLANPNLVLTATVLA